MSDTPISEEKALEQAIHADDDWGWHHAFSEAQMAGIEAARTGGVTAGRRATVAHLRKHFVFLGDVANADSETREAALQDLAYYNGAKAYAVMSAQSEEDAHKWLLGGCGGRQESALKALLGLKTVKSGTQVSS